MNHIVSFEEHSNLNYSILQIRKKKVGKKCYLHDHMTEYMSIHMAEEKNI